MFYCVHNTILCCTTKVVPISYYKGPHLQTTRSHSPTFDESLALRAAWVAHCPAGRLFSDFECAAIVAGASGRALCPPPVENSEPAGVAPGGKDGQAVGSLYDLLVDLVGMIVICRDGERFRIAKYHEKSHVLHLRHESGGWLRISHRSVVRFA